MKFNELKSIKSIVCSAILLMGLSLSANAKTTIATGKVTRLISYNSGTILVSGFTFPESTCNNNGAFFISGEHPHFDKLLSVILAAKAMQSEMSVVAKVDDCWYPEITIGGEMTYFVTN